MNVTEMVEAMHATHLPSEPDLVRIKRQGRRIALRRYTAVTVGAALTCALMAAPWLVLSDGRSNEIPPATETQTSTGADDSWEREFESTAPIGAPIAGVAQTKGKFYLPPNHVRSVGAMAFWSEAATPDDEIAYGARLIDKDGSLRRAGYLQLPSLPPDGGELIPVPGQHGEPTFVGLLPLPENAVASDYRIRVQSTDTLVLKGKSADVVAGKLLVWVTALTGSKPGIDLEKFVIRDAEHHLIAQGTFQQ